MAGAVEFPTDAELQARVGASAATMLAEIDSALLRKTATMNAAPGPALVGAAEGATLLVVGSRGHGTVAGALLGSVSLHCVNHSTTPVAVIPADTFPDEPFNRIVVGVDGSDHSVAALTWVLETSPETIAVDVFFVWGFGSPFSEQAILDGADVEQRAIDIARHTVERAKATAGQADREIRTGTAQGDAREELRIEATKADMIVVGARGREGLLHLVLGSVATSLVHSPTTPTVIVR